MPFARAIALLALLMLSTGMGGPARAGEPILLALDPAHADAGAAQVLSGELDPHFSTPVPLTGVLPHSSQSRWFRLGPLDAVREGRWVLSQMRLPIRDLRVYLPDGEGGWRMLSASFFRPDPMGLDYSPQAFAFPLDAAAADMPVYLRIEHGGRLYLDLAIEREAEFRATERRFVVAITAAVTALAVMLLMNLVFWVRLRERMYLTYVAFIGGLLAWTLFATGLVHLWWPGSGEWRLPGSPTGMLVAASMALMLQFVREYVGLARIDRTGDRATAALAWAFGVLAVCYALPGAAQWRAVAMFSSAVFGLMPALLLVVLLRGGWRGSRAAWLFLVAWLPLAWLSAMRTLAGLGLVPPSPLTLFGPLGAVAFESVVLAVGLAGRALELRLQRDRALRLAEVDALTGALNRHAGESRLEEMFGAARARGIPMSVVFLDMDRLKQVNDTCSHDAGDLCLRVLVGRAQALMPPRAEVVRWGGDEFVMLLPGMFPEDARVLAARVREALLSSPVMFDGRELPLSASIGVAGIEPEDASGHDMVRRADAALYRDKRAGRPVGGDQALVGG